MANLAYNWMGAVQYNNEGFPPNINNLCTFMINSTTNPLATYAALSNLFLQNFSCIDISYESYISALANLTANTTGFGFRQWTYQTCTEFGYFQTTDAASSLQPFGNLISLQFNIDSCVDGFGIDFSVASRVNDTNTNYGGKYLSSGPTNILFVNGNIDPWHSLSVTTDLSRTVRAILINGTAHCADMTPFVPGNSPALAVAQAEISQYISKFLRRSRRHKI